MKRVLLSMIVFVLAACTSGSATGTPAAPPANTTTATVGPVRPPTATPMQPPPTGTPLPTASVTPEPAGPRPAFTLGVEPAASRFDEPVHVTHAGDDRLFVVEQPGRIRVIHAQRGEVLEAPFLDIVSLVNSQGFEQGLLSVAFHPDYAANGEFFVNYTRRPDGATVVARYRVSGDPNVADPGSAEILLTIPQPERNHNGGLVKFGPDGYLYIGTGDGGGAGDRHGTIGNGQDPGALLGKILRIDVNDGEPYAIPGSNPFVDAAGYRPEIWSLGWRNPWRFSFDRATGDLYVADVGQGQYEEVDFQPASSAGGENYGWRIMEGNHCYSSADCDQSGLVRPVAEYNHDFGCSVTGGYVYRGEQYPWLDGVYVFADYCSGIVWSLERDASGAWLMTEQMDVDFAVSSFGEDVVGELYLAGHTDGVIYRLTSTSP